MMVCHSANITLFSLDLENVFHCDRIYDKMSNDGVSHSIDGIFWIPFIDTSAKKFFHDGVRNESFANFIIRINTFNTSFYDYCRFVTYREDNEIMYVRFKTIPILDKSLGMLLTLVEKTYDPKPNTEKTCNCRSKAPLPEIVNVWYNHPYTTVVWSDNTITKAKCKEGDIFDKDTGLSICIAKKYYQYMGYNSFAKALKDTNDKSVDVPKRQAQTMARKMHKKLSLGLME